MQRLDARVPAPDEQRAVLPGAAPGQGLLATRQVATAASGTSGPPSELGSAHPPSASSLLPRVEGPARLLQLRARRLLGQGVAIAVVDDGIHAPSLREALESALREAQGAFPRFDPQRSRVDGLPQPFSRGRRSHASMCAFDACLAAPGCTLLDVPTHAPRPLGKKRVALVLQAYRQLAALLRSGELRQLVVLNAWQALPSDALGGVPPDDPRHPLYQALDELDAAGADVIFAAPDHHASGIHGPALHPRVLTVAAVNLDGSAFACGVRPQPCAARKPDIANYQGFAGYGLFRGFGDYGTSAAAALSAGLVAALRSLPRARGKSPAELRELLRTSAAARAEARGPGVLDVLSALERL